MKYVKNHREKRNLLEMMVNVSFIREVNVMRVARISYNII